MSFEALLGQYQQAIPRYTSYPTVPNWLKWEDSSIWQNELKRAAASYNVSEGIALYLHLPYCEHLCTYCGCNKKITTNHAVEQPYIKRILEEWKRYTAIFKEHLLIRELHLGGGTPTFFAPKALKELVNGIFSSAKAHAELEMSFEGHPNNTTFEHLRVLHELGFNRVSYGVQDLDPEVQRVINRIQPLDSLVDTTRMARSLGYQSVNYDLVYGLPLQDEIKLSKTLQEVIKLRPDRVAFYGYAHVPWKSRAQRLYDETDLPDAHTRLKLYQLGRRAFLENGYAEIGMDHFALPNDALAHAQKQGRLHRNFMGYTTSNSSILIGLGVSAISDLGFAFAQNSKELGLWERAVDEQAFAVDKGFLLSADDEKRRDLILNMSCNGSATLEANWQFEPHQQALLEQMQTDGLLSIQHNKLQLSEGAQPFTRHACSLFDAYLDAPSLRVGKQFSQAV